MSNTCNEYMRELRAALSDFDPEFSAEILEDFEQHFERSISEGKSEEEICRELGAVEDIVRELGETFPSSPDVPKVTIPNQQSDQEQLPAPAKLYVQLLNASVQISSGAVSDVVCHYDRTDFDERYVMYTEGDSFYLKEKPLSFLQLLGIGRAGSGHFQLILPASVREIQVSTANGKLSGENLNVHRLSLRAPNGALRLCSAEGSILEVQCVNGRATLESCRFDSLHASSVNGSVEAGGEFQTCSLSSTNGALIFYGAAGRKLDLHTVNGKIQAVYQKASMGASLSLSTTCGSITAGFNGSQVKCHKKFQTSYGDGGLAIQARTVNGSIRVQEEP